MATEKTASKAGWIALGAAGLALVAALSFAALRGQDAVKKPAPPAASLPADHPATLATIEARTRAAPNDAEAWRALGQARFDGALYAEAAAAYEHGTKLAPERADLWSGLGEATVMASRTDPMPAAALAAFRKAAAIDPKDPRSRYFLAVARDLSGEHDGAIADWLKLLADTPPGAPWEQDLRRTIEQVGKINHIDVASRLAAIKPPATHPVDTGAPMPGPSAEDLRAAAALTPSQQNAMAEGMVGRLEAKLQADPSNVDGWVMLMRSRMMLNDPAKAGAALKAAVKANPAAAARLRAEASSLGVPAS